MPNLIKSHVGIDAMASTRSFVAINSIIADNSFQPRTELNGDHVFGMVEALRQNPATFDTKLIQCWRIAGKLNLIDGFHRLAAFKEVGLGDVTVEVHETDRGDLDEGEHLAQSRSEALAMAVSANNHLGSPLRRTRADNRRAVELMLSDPNIRKWSDSRIASEVGVSIPTVGTIRASNPEWSSDIRITSSGRKVSATLKPPKKRNSENLDIRPTETASDAPLAIKPPIVAPDDQQSSLEPPRAFKADYAHSLEITNRELRAELANANSRIQELEAQLADLTRMATNEPEPEPVSDVVTTKPKRAKEVTPASLSENLLLSLNEESRKWTDASNRANLAKYKAQGVITGDEFKTLKDRYSEALKLQNGLSPKLMFTLEFQDGERIPQFIPVVN